MKFRSLLLGILGAVTVTCTVAAAQPAPPKPAEMMKNVIEVPGTDMWAVERDGKVVFMSKNRRYAIVGKIIDTFERKEIKTMDDVRASRRLNFKRVGMDWNELSTLTVGNGPKEIVIFTDPYCAHCKEMVRQAMPLASNYTIRFVLFPILKPQSRATAGRLLCSGDARAAVDRLLTEDYQDLEGASADCATSKLMNTAFTGMTFNIYAVPYIFAPNGEPHMGRVKNLRQFVEENAS